MAATTKRPSSLASVLLVGAAILVLWLPGSRPSRDVPLAACPIFVVKDWKFGGEMSADGWKGSALYEYKGGVLKLGMTGAESAVSSYDVGLGFAPAKNLPYVDLAMSHKPGKGTPVAGSKCPMVYSAKLSKTVPKCPYAPKLGATLNNNGVALDAEMTRSKGKADFGLKLEVPFTYSGTIDPTVSAEAGYELAGGKLVGTVTTKASGGSRFAATYKLR